MLGPGKATRAATADQTAVSRPPHARLRVTAQPSSPQACGVGLGRPQDSGPWQATLAGGGRGRESASPTSPGAGSGRSSPPEGGFLSGPPTGTLHLRGWGLLPASQTTAEGRAGLSGSPRCAPAPPSPQLQGTRGLSLQEERK